VPKTFASHGVVIDAGRGGEGLLRRIFENRDGSELELILEKEGLSLMRDKTHKAATVSPGRTCPVCGKGDLRRLTRKGWMSRVPYSKYYGCSKCRTGFLRLFDTIQLRVADGTGGGIGSISSCNRKKKLVLVFTAITGLVYVCYRIVISLYESGLE